jgi:hypothetical protein
MIAVTPAMAEKVFTSRRPDSRNARKVDIRPKGLASTPRILMP